MDSMLMGITAEFPWGILQVLDLGSREAGPARSSGAVDAGRSILHARVAHGQDGPIQVRVLSAPSALPTLLFEGAIEVASGVLVVGDAASEQGVRVPTQFGSVRLRINANRLDRPDEIDIELVGYERP